MSDFTAQEQDRIIFLAEHLEDTGWVRINTETFASHSSFVIREQAMLTEALALAGLGGKVTVNGHALLARIGA